MRSVFYKAIVLIFILIGNVASATHYYVDPNGDDDANGLSWATAFATVQKGIDTAVTDDIVEVNEGTYYEWINFSGKAITLTSTDPNNPNIAATTIINANNTSKDVVTFNHGEDANSILDGLTIRGGQYGVKCSGASPLIKNCRIMMNNLDGVYVFASAHPEIFNCHISHNSQCGICSYNGGSPEIVDCNISNNSSLGLYCYGTGSVKVSGSLIGNNGAGGVYSRDYIDATFINCVIAKNSGRGMREYRCAGYGHQIRIINGTIAHNTGNGVEGQFTEIRNSIIWGNSTGTSYTYVQSMTYSCIQGGCTGVGNFAVNPMFVNVSNNDFHLSSNSVCIDTGQPWADYSNEPSPNGGRINIGAYGNTNEATVTTDSDSDGLSDAWEQYYFGNLSYDANGNPDGDNFRNISEYLFGYDPNTYTSKPMVLAYAKLSSSEFNPAIGETLTITYWLNKDANAVLTCTDNGNSNNIFAIQEYIFGGMNQLVWDGRDSNGEIFLKSFFDISVDANDNNGSTAHYDAGTAELYYANDIIHISCNPKRILPLNNEVTTVSFDLTCDANAVVNVYTPEDALFRTIHVRKDEPNEVVWDGKNKYANDPDGRYVSIEGEYRVEVKLEGMKENEEDIVSVYK
ncbi:MAG: right-handed parallel beta-helix repeat-containing protein [Sedimentisphaerales bacterium]